MRLEEIRQQFKDEFVLIEVTKTEDTDETAILEGNILAHSRDREEILDLMVKAPNGPCMATRVAKSPEDKRESAYVFK